MRLGVATAVAAIGISAAVGSARAADAPLPPLREARPDLPPAAPAARVPWEAHIEVGAGVAVTELLAGSDADGNATPVRFKPAVGFHVDLSWQIFRYLRFTGYLVEHPNALDLPSGSLGFANATLTGSAHVFTFGARVSPTIPFGTRFRLWLTAGAGWGRVDYGRITVTPSGAMPFVLRERSASVVEVPLGLGAAFEIIPRWLSVHVEVLGSFFPSQVGDATEHGQASVNGGMKDVRPMPRIDGGLVQTLGLSLHL